MRIKLTMAAVLGSATFAATAELAVAAMRAGDPPRPGATTPGSAHAPQPKPPAPPTLYPRAGRPFQPAQGDWEGTAEGFPASFELRLGRAAANDSARYTVTNLVVLAPAVCPLSSTHYRETFLGDAAVRVAGNGYFPLTSGGFSGGLAAAHSADLSTAYQLGSCSGTLRWHMHPADRVLVDDGQWSAHFGTGASVGFSVQGGGRLATGLALPAALAACNGTRGGVDLFIASTGRATLSPGNVTLRLRFSGRTARGSLTARGCAPMTVTASRDR